MNVNSTNFTQAYQTIRPAQVVNERPSPVAPEQKVAAAANAIDYKQPHVNFDTYVQAYQSATGTEASNTTDDLTYDNVQNINQTMTRHQIANSDILSNFVGRQDEIVTPAPYLQAGLQTQTGGIINTYA